MSLLGLLATSRRLSLLFHLICYARVGRCPFWPMVAMIVVFDIAYFCLILTGLVQPLSFSGRSPSVIFVAFSLMIKLLFFSLVYLPDCFMAVVLFVAKLVRFSCPVRPVGINLWCSWSIIGECSWVWSWWLLSLRLGLFVLSLLCLQNWFSLDIYSTSLEFYRQQIAWISVLFQGPSLSCFLLLRCSGYWCLMWFLLESNLLCFNLELYSRVVSAFLMDQMLYVLFFCAICFFVFLSVVVLSPIVIVNLSGVIVVGERILQFSSLFFKFCSVDWSNAEFLSEPSSMYLMSNCGSESESNSRL